MAQAEEHEAGAVEDVELEQRDLVRFERADEFRELLAVFLAQPTEPQLAQLSTMLEEYQEQPYLLDPYLDAIVAPAVSRLQQSVRAAAGLPGSSSSAAVSESLQRIARLLYVFTKVRGYKTIIHFFPHSVEDLHPALLALESTAGDAPAANAPAFSSTWELRYILLLWLSLVCMIPFDLSKFDRKEMPVADQIEAVGRRFLGASGKERDAAAVMLGKLFQRRDAVQLRLERFLQWAHEQLMPPAQPSIFLTTGVFQALCEIVKVSDAVAIAPHLPAINAILDIYSPPLGADEAALDADVTRAGVLKNSLVSKFRTKLTGRLGLKMLRPRKRTRFVRAKVLGDPMRHAATGASHATGEGGEGDEDEEDVPEEVDGVIARLMMSLQDKDTVVRYSAAKALSRLCERLPGSFIDQVADAIASLFAINVADIMGDRSDLSSVSEHTWQGACLALAELGRRGLLKGDELGEKLEWVQKALLFDIRRGAHSVGAGVRDAACYVLWALARAHDADAMRPHALALAQRLVNVSCLDRDVSIRRAASAAYQECAGRLNLFPHGIDVIRKADFFAVSMRRSSFLECAPQVAVHAEYRQSLLDHLLSVTATHWDPAMRELGAKTVARVAALQFEELAPQIAGVISAMCKARDTPTLHGALLVLEELARLCIRNEGETAKTVQLQIFASLDRVPRSALRMMGGAMVLRAACGVIEASASAEALASTGEPAWEAIVQAAMSRSEENVQLAAARALRTVSGFQDCTARIDSTVISKWRSLLPAEQQSHARALGFYQYLQCEGAFEPALRFLLGLVSEKAPNYSQNIETRRNAYEAIVAACNTLDSRIAQVLSPSLAKDILRALLAGLEDYTTDQRGDVGSWVRLACVAGLRQLLELYRVHAAVFVPLADWLAEEDFHATLAGLMKQMVERIDSVRSEAGEQLLAVCRAPTQEHFYAPVGVELLEILFPRGEVAKFKQPDWLFSRAMRLLALPPYRAQLLRGIVTSLGTKTEMAQSAVATSLCDYVLASPDTAPEVAAFPPYGTLQIVDDLRELAMRNYSANRIYVPAIQTLTALLEANVAEEKLDDDEAATVLLRRILTMVTKNLDKFKSPMRINACMQLTVNMLRVSALRSEALAHCSAFLSHSFPTLRGATSELLYTTLQDVVELPEEAEELLLTAPWSSNRADCFRPEAARFVALVQASEEDT